MIRVLHVLGRLDRGGAETFVMNIYRKIDRSKIQFDFIKHTKDKCDYDDEIIDLGGRIFSLPRYNVKNHFQYKRKWKDFFREHPEISAVHGHMRSTASIYLDIARVNEIVTIAHSHSTASRGSLVERLIKKLLQLPLRYRVDYLFACSNDAGKWLFGKSVVLKENYVLFKNSIDIEKFLFNQIKRDEMRKLLGVENKIVIGHVGSFTYPKNHKFLIQIFSEVKRKNQNLVLLLLGDGELKDSIIKQLKDLDVIDDAILLGNQPNISDYLQAMDVFVFPSIFEGLGISLIEAQVSGLPCIISEKIPNEAIISEKVYKISLRKVEDWAKQILLINLSDNRNIDDTIFYSRGYSIDEQVFKIEKFYLNTSNRRS
ncbi:MAG: glycosyltransferase family 1 protein [Gudongella sp.]|jgi:glycosyltransferase involved in cell wall biosynthesis|nr:glycosyltransferase family 1 protein [Gudongella sp.]